jgi:hypothetical protein
MSTAKQQNFTSGYQMSLTSTPNPRLADLAKMRSKLATSLPTEVQNNQIKQERRVKWTLHGLGYVISGVAMLGLVFLISWAALADRDTVTTRAKSAAQSLIPPGEARSIDDQTLYWAYALYDFRMLVKAYNVPPTALVDTRRASEELNRLFPKASATAQLKVMQYRKQLVRKLK